MSARTRTVMSARTRTFRTLRRNNMRLSWEKQRLAREKYDLECEEALFDHLLDTHFGIPSQAASNPPTPPFFQLISMPNSDYDATYDALFKDNAGLGGAIKQLIAEIKDLKTGNDLLQHQLDNILNAKP
jgi:hypothetical protein